MKAQETKENRSQKVCEDNEEKYIFSNETIQSLRELGGVLQGIHNRLISEGYAINDGKLVKPFANNDAKQRSK